MKHENPLVQMGVDLYFGYNKPETLKFSVDESEALFTKGLIEESCKYAGIAAPEKMDYKTFKHPLFQHAFFNLIGENIEAIIPKVLTNQFDQFVEVRNANWGDQLIYEVSSPDLFQVAKVAKGTRNVRKQRLDGRSATLTPVMREVGIGEDLFRILSGRVNWAQFVNKVALSFASQIKADVYAALYGSFDASNATYMYSGTYDLTKFKTIVQHVQAACGGQRPACFGTSLALNKTTPSTGMTAYPGLMSQQMLDELNLQGFLGYIQGTPTFEIEQAHVPNTDNFAISDNFLLIIPNGIDKPVKLGFEGDTIVAQDTGVENADLSQSYTIQKAYDVQVLAAAKYGIIQLA